MTARTGPLHGFSLLELLVAMSLMIVVASCLYGSLYMGFNAKRTALVAVEPDSVALTVIDLIKQDLSGTLAPTGTFANSFVGTDSRFGQDDTDSLTFFTTNVFGGKTTLKAGMSKVELILEDNEQGDNYRLVRKVTNNLLSPKEVDPEEQVLCRSVKSLNFRFYDGNDWVDEWDSGVDANSVPLAVEVDIGIAYDDSKAKGASSVLSRSDRLLTSGKAKEYKTRRLIEKFPIPCGGEAAVATSTTSTDTSGGGSTTP
jgi:prepilin-type N-terminal cleavage/methylation domain-containing protein